MPLQEIKIMGNGCKKGHLDYSKEEKLSKEDKVKRRGSFAI
jgi:hypothetical protein